MPYVRGLRGFCGGGKDAAVGTRARAKTHQLHSASQLSMLSVRGRVEGRGVPDQRSVEALPRQVMVPATMTTNDAIRLLSKALSGQYNSTSSRSPTALLAAEPGCSFFPLSQERLSDAPSLLRTLAAS